jgi:chromosome segregation ATPase
VFAPGAVQTGGQMFDDRDRDRINRNDRDGQPQFQVHAQDKSDMEKELENVRMKAEAKEKSIKAQGENMSGILSGSNPAVSIASTNGAFSKYASHIKTMVANAERFKAALLAVIDKLFLIVKTEAGQPKITIHPALSNEELDKLVNQTRDIIVQLYLGCERDFYTGLKLLRVIIEEKMQENMEAALSALKTETKTAIKNISSKQRIKNESDVARRQDEVNQLQQFQNPVFDEEMQKAKADAANEKYNTKKELEYEIKQLEQDKSQKETEKNDLESKIAYYEGQIKQLDATSDKTQIDMLKTKIGNVTTSLNDINSEISDITAKTELKRDELRNLTS